MIAPSASAADMRPAAGDPADDLHVTVPPHGLPYDPTAGAHELAWCYLLDLVFADAYASGLTSLGLAVPSVGLGQAVAERTHAWRPAVGAFGHGEARLTRDPRPLQAARVVYLLEYGALAPARLRGGVAAPAGFRCDRTVSVYPLRARLWGVPIRLAYLIARPDLADRFHARMRRAFHLEGRRPAYYHLTIWRAP